MFVCGQHLIEPAQDRLRRLLAVIGDGAHRVEQVPFRVGQGADRCFCLAQGPTHGCFRRFQRSQRQGGDQGPIFRLA